MARVTVEDCILRVPNRFELVMLAAQRARAISAGAALTVDRDNDRNPVVALREIAEETVNVKDLETSLIKDQQKHVELDEPEEDEMDVLAIQQEMSGERSETVSAAEASKVLLHVEGEDGDVAEEAEDAEESEDAEEPEDAERPETERETPEEDRAES